MVKSIRTDKICEAMWWTSGLSGFISILWLLNTYQNQVKLCTLKVQDDVQLAIAKFCLSIKDFRSQASFNDFTIKSMGPKILA